MTMIEDALREAFAAKAGTEPPRSLDGIADVAIRNAGRIRRRRRTAVTGFAAFVVMAVAAVATFQVIAPSTPGGPIAQSDTGRQTTQPQATAGTQTAPPAAAKEVPAIDGQAQPSQTVRLKLPDNGTVAAAYKAKDGYLVVNTGGGGGNKQLVLQDEHDNQQVLVKKASDIAVAKDGDKVAWAQEGMMTVASRSTTSGAGSPNPASTAPPKLTQQATAEVPQSAVPVTFVGPNLVLGREEGAGYNVWYPGREYTESWDPDVLRIFGVHPDAKSVYAEVRPVEDEKSMCLALLALDQPFEVVQWRCGLPVAAKAGGGRVSPDGKWLAYPVEGLKQVAVLDLTKIFTGGAVKTWTLNVTTKTVWMNASTFVVDSGGKFCAITPTAAAGTFESLNTESEGVVLIEPLYSG
ncbi:hypothetical protein AB0H83_49650 [Dactylosporangium sp. NPDC050688]|uniref:hypothetical protein n=1 Tax=Dactylosporangium sp. NPDC050688 TaxID=3157217 RepID=UPI0033E6BEAF